MMPASVVDRSAPPPPGEIRAFRFPPFLRRMLPGGLTVYAARVVGVPLVSLELVARAGAQHDPISPDASRAGLATFTASLIDEGSARRDAMEIAAWVERLGGYLYSAADWDSGYVAAALLSQHLDAGLDLLAEIALSPSFPEREIERIRKQRLAELLRRAYDPSSQADDRLSEAVYAGTPYAAPLLGRAASVESLGRDEVVAFYESHYSLSGATVIAVGDLDPEALIRAVETRLAPRPGQEPAPESPEIVPAPLDGIQVHIVDRPGAAQTELRLGHAGVTRTHPDFRALTVLNMLLGGKFTSRINMNLRERHGYTYGASSRFAGRLGPGPFVVDAAVSTVSAGAAVREVLGELRLIREELVTTEEIEETLSYMVGVYPYTLQTIGDVAKRLEVLAVFELPDDYYDTYTELLARTTRDEILEAARRHVHPERIAVVAVGPADELVPQFDGVGEVTVHRRPAASRE